MQRSYNIGAILLAIQITLEAILKILKECLLRSRPHRPHAHKAIGEWYTCSSMHSCNTNNKAIYVTKTQSCDFSFDISPQWNTIVRLNIAFNSFKGYHETNIWNAPKQLNVILWMCGSLLRRIASHININDSMSRPRLNNLIEHKQFTESYYSLLGVWICYKLALRIDEFDYQVAIMIVF